MQSEQLVASLMAALDDGKAKDILQIDVREKSSMTDYMLIASGTSGRHVKALAHAVIETAKNNGVQPLGNEGLDVGEWALVDLDEVIVHVMQEETRSFYDLERLWQGAAQSRTAQEEA